MTDPQYQEYTPEHRVAQLARQGSGLSDEEVLRQAGYVPHDGTWLRDDLLAQYRRESAAAGQREASAQAPRNPASRDAAFTLLLQHDWFRGMDADEASGVTTELLNDFYASGSADLQAFARDWAPEPESEAGR